MWYLRSAAKRNPIASEVELPNANWLGLTHSRPKLLSQQYWTLLPSIGAWVGTFISWILSSKSSSSFIRSWLKFSAFTPWLLQKSASVCNTCGWFEARRKKHGCAGRAIRSPFLSFSSTAWWALSPTLIASRPKRHGTRPSKELAGLSIPLGPFWYFRDHFPQRRTTFFASCRSSSSKISKSARKAKSSFARSWASD